MKITRELLREWGACYDDRKIAALVPPNGLTPIQVAELDIPTQDRLWVLLRPDIISDRDLRLLACKWAEGVLPIYEQAHPGDRRPRQAIEVARRYAEGEASANELIAARDAVSAAARAAVSAAAWAAAMDAAWAAVSAAASAAAMDAAWAAVSAAASAAAWDAASAAARAAVSAAVSAAASAAAWAAAMDAAWAAVSAAASAAAWDAQLADVVDILSRAE